MKIRRFIERILSYSSQHLWAFILLSFAAALQTSNVVLFDTLANSIYLSRYGQTDLAFNFFMAALFLVGAGAVILRQNRFFGKGFLPFLSFALLFQIGIAYAVRYEVPISADILFITKWAYRAILFGGFWNYAFRFIELDLKSKRFLFLVLCELFGFMASGLIIYFTASIFSFKLFFILLGCSTVGLFVLLAKISAFEKITPELQQKKNGGINEKTQKMLVYLIYTTAFLFSAIFAFIDYTMCLEALKTVGKTYTDLMRFYGVTWGLVGSFALFLLSVLYTLRRSFYITTPLTILSFLPLTCALGYFSNILWIVIFSKICLELILYFCMGYYFRMLSRPLSRSSKPKIKAATFLMAIPLGFAFTALVLYFIPFEKSALILACGLSFVFLLALIDDQNEYAKVLLCTFKTFRWQGGRLIITSPAVMQYITQKTDSPNPAEAIYFLRVLEEAQVPNFKKHLRHALNHSNPLVRCFALDCIERNDLHMFKKTLSDILDKDENVEVRQKALSVFCALGEKYGTEKAVLYLDDNNLKKGALIGLLKTGGEGVLIASDGLNKLVYSKNPALRLEAAQVLTEASRKGFFRLISALMQDKELNVKKQAFYAAGLCKHPALLDLLLRALDNFKLRDTALAALKSYGSVAYGKIKEVLAGIDYNENIKKNLIRFLWVAEDIETKYILLSCLKKLPLDLRIYAMDFLSQKPVYLTKKQRKRIFIPLIDTDFRQALTTLLLIQDLRTTSLLEDKTYFDLLIDSLYNDFLKIRYCLLSELNFLLPSSFMKQATQILKKTSLSEAEKNVALSTLDDILPKKSKPLRLIIDVLPLPDRIEKLPTHIQNKTNFDQQFSFILRGKSYRSLWTKLCALTCIRRLNEQSIISDVVDLLSDKNDIIRQSALWTLDRLITDKKKRKTLFAPLMHDKNVSIANMATELIK